MKTTKKILALLLCLSALMLLSLAAYAAGGETNLYAEVDVTEVEIDDEICLEIYVNDMTVSAIKAGFYFDNTKLEIVDMSFDTIVYLNTRTGKYNKKASPTSETDIDDANEKGSALGVYAINSGVDTPCQEGVLVTVYFKAIAAGEATITLREESAGTDAFKSDSIDPITITIKEAATCDHSTTKLVPNDNGTHNVVCANAECNHVVNENVTCTGTDDGDCTTAVICECGNIVTAAKDSHTGGEATCSKKAVCSECGKEYGELNAANHKNTYIAEGFYPDSNDYAYHYQWLACNDCTNKTLEKVNFEKHEDQMGDGNHNCDKCGETCSFHTGGNATCSSWAVCEECSAAYGELDKDEHEPGKGSYYRNNGEDHTFVCSCGADIRNEAHDYTYDAESHKCVCGEVETYTLTIEVLATNETVELTVPYGANILEVLEKAAAEDKIPTIDDVICIENKYQNGEATISGYSYCVDGGKWIYDLEGLTMPAADFKVDQDCVYIGWYYNYDEDDVYVGAEYEDETGWLTPGWHYIEEDYDDVEGGAWYYFYEVTIEYTDGEYTGNIRAEGLTRATYPTEPINGKTYAPNAEDLAYADFIDATEAWFVFGEDGKFQFDMTEIMDGKYVENGMIAWHPGFVKVEGVWYYFVGDIENGGNKAAQGLIYVTRNADAAGFVKGDRVWFADGKLDTTKSGVIDGYYYEKGKLMVGAGLIKIGEDIYYVRSSGKVATGKYYITKSNDLAGFATGMKLYFDENGKMLPVKSGVVDGYYYENGRIVYGAGLIKINGDVYYVCSSGKVATGEYYITKTNGMDGFNAGDKLTFGEDGKLLPVKSGVVDGYYYENGRIAYGAGLIKIDGDIYYVRSNGEVATGKYWVTNTNGLLEAGEYNFGTDGKLITE